MKVQAKTPSTVVGEQVRALRKRRNWNQTQLAERLEQLGCVGWRQSKIARVERGKQQRLPLEDVLELAAALDCPPVQLIAPPIVMNDKGDKPLRVAISTRIARWPREVRAWLDSEQPLLGRIDYRTDEEWTAAQRFFYFESRPFSEWTAQELERQKELRAREEEK